jgi:hypothetical protein
MPIVSPGPVLVKVVAVGVVVLVLEEEGLVLLEEVEVGEVLELVEDDGVVVVVVGVVVVVVGVVVVVVVVVEVGFDCPEKVIFTITSSPDSSPKVMLHVSPAAIWAAVGGHGYLAASVVASPPALSLPVDGGPIVPVWTVKEVAGRLPFLSVETIVKSGLEQDTGTALPSVVTVG